MSGITPSMVSMLIPEIGLTLLALVLLVFSLFKSEKLNRSLGWVTAGGAGIIALLTYLLANPGDSPSLAWGEMLRFDQPGYFFALLFLAGSGLTALFASTDATISPKPEFYMLLVFSTIGFCLMAAAANLIMLYLAVETASIPLYVLAGLKFRDKKSVESGIKYFLFGALSSALMLYGFSLLYGFSGTTRIYAIADGIAAQAVPLAAVILAVLLVFAGFAFKISAVPFHFWTPDVYEGAPTPVAGFLSTVSKAAGFAAFIRILLVVFGAQTGNIWMILVAVMSAASMLVGNLVAIPQTNLKRLIAYSSIAQAGYVLIGVAAGSSLGITGTAYYLLSYLVTNLAVFGIISRVEKETGSSEISAFKGLNRRAPSLALLLMIALLSLGGIPPFAGFFAKVLVLGAAVESHLLWLAILGIINSVVGLYYYLRVMKVMYMEAPDSQVSFAKPPVLWLIALVVCLAGIIILGVVFTPWFSAAMQVATGF